MTIKTQNLGIYQTLIAQLDKTARHNRQGSFRTKEQYYEAMQRFCRFLSEEYRLQKLANISGKHLTAYVIHMQERGKSASTIKTDLAGIRFFHDKMERTKYRLPSNDELAVELERRRFGGVDRTWSVQEFHRFLATCMADGHEGFAARTYQELIDSGLSPLSASLRVSQLLGHERPDVTKGYLASIPKGGADGK